MDIIEELKKIPVANIGDACDRMACMLGDIKSMNHQLACGRAYTIDVPAGDNLLFYYAIEKAHKGDIIVVDGKGDCHRALCGEIMRYAYWGPIDIVSAGTSEMKKRYGFIYVDKDNNGTIKRSIKDSFYYYKHIIENNGKEL